MLSVSTYKRCFSALLVPLAGILTIFIYMTSCNNTPEKSDEEEEAVYFKDYEAPESKWGYINTLGDLVIPARYDEASHISEGMAAVNLRGKWGYIDTAGHTVIDFQFKAAWPFSEGVGRVLNFNGSWTLVYRDGRQNTLPLEIVEVYDASDGLLRFKQNFRTGYLNSEGTIIIAPEYEQGWDFEGGTARIRLNEKVGLIDTTGQLILPAEYDKLINPGDSWIPAKTGTLHYYINRHSNTTLQDDWSYVNSFHHGAAAVSGAGSKYLIDTTGQQISGFFQSLRYAGSGRWVCERDGKFALSDANGTVLCNFEYDQINNFSEGYAVFMQDGYYGYLDLECLQFIPPQFGLAWDFSGGFARAAFRDGIAYIDTSGTVPFLPDFQDIRDFHEGYAAVQEW